MATLAIENTIFTLTSGVGVDEYTQSGHGPSPALNAIKPRLTSSTAMVVFLCL
jgi:hypothetical protein